MKISGSTYASLGEIAAQGAGLCSVFQPAWYVFTSFCILWLSDGHRKVLDAALFTLMMVSVFQNPRKHVSHKRIRIFPCWFCS